MSDDLISRQAAIDAIKKDVMGGLNYEFIIKKLPSVQPEQKIGRWVPSKYTDTVLCSQCGKCYGDEYNYCPNCGAYMKGESNDQTTSN